MRRSTNVLVNTDSLDSVLQEFLDYCRSKNLSPHTVGYYRDRLKQFFGFCHGRLGVADVSSVSSASVRAFITHAMDSDCSTATINHTIKAARALFNYLVDEGRLQTSFLDRIKLLRAEKKIIETFSNDHIERILSECDTVGLSSGYGTTQ